ncbi:hypothetical protein [Pandoraea terrigena]|uniref:Uncharacterized protein n=1 Tax=Pandoraea terrigena TaxID=2508292 RepID=A0A5E4RQM0_9BURK|nr:hypothetical protein [Pandoraea terrigena]VVD65706.1 hypothetical protein PTE31013_00339 [Pandoraea terrigena]
MTTQTFIAHLTEKQKAARESSSIKEIPICELERISGARSGNVFVNATWSRAI